MDAIDIKYAIEKAGSTQTAIAKTCGVSQVQVFRVINNLTVSDHVRREIARVIGRDVKEIWPEYYLKKVLGG